MAQFPGSYNRNDPEDILRYSQWLIGKSFQDILDAENHTVEGVKIVSGYQIQDGQGQNVLNEPAASYGRRSRKGGLGNLVEEHFYHYDANSNSEADFPGLELKVTPYEEHVSKKGVVSYSAGERLVLTMIDYNRRPHEMDFFHSHLWQKCSKILLIHYMRERDLLDNLQYRIHFVNIFTPNERDLIIIKEDYEYILGKIIAGKAHELSEGDTMYLGACTKGKNAAESTVVQITGGIQAKKRAFCYKTSYMTMVLNEYVMRPKEKLDHIISNNDIIQGLTFEEIIQKRIASNVGKTDKELCREYGIEYTGNKAQWIQIVYKILGIKSNRAEEFVKANIVVKCTRIEEDGRIVENSPLPAFNFMDLVQEVWVEYDEVDDGQIEIGHPSALQAYLSETKFFFVMFQKKGDCCILRGCKLWNMPSEYLNSTVRQGWQNIHDILSAGVVLTLKEVKSGKRAGCFNVTNNFPSQNDNEAIHIRPHAQKSYYKFNDGLEWGNPSDGDLLPDGRYMTKQSFWLNNSYLEKILGLR